MRVYRISYINYIKRTDRTVFRLYLDKAAWPIFISTKNKKLTIENWVNEFKSSNTIYGAHMSSFVTELMNAGIIDP